MKFSSRSRTSRRPTSFGWMLTVACAGAGTGLAVVACGGDDVNGATITTTDAGVTITQSIGAAGGTITAPDGTSISIPAGALSGTQKISITQGTAAMVPGSIATAGTPYIFGPEGLQFAFPVTLTLDVNAAAIPAGKTESDVVVYTAPVGTTSFTTLPATNVDATHVAAQTTHFSIFVPGLSEGDGGAPITDGAVPPVSDGASPPPASDSGPTDAETPNDGGSEPTDAAGLDGSIPPPAIPTVLVSGQAGPESIAVNGTDIYWTNTAGGTVQSAALDGTSPVTLATGESQPFSIVLSPTTVYWGAVYQAPTPPIENATIYSQPLTGADAGAPTVVYRLGGNNFQGVALNGSNLIVSSLSSVLSITTAGVATTLASGQTFAQTFTGNVTADGTNAYWVTAAATGGGEGGTSGPNGSVFSEPYATPTTPTNISQPTSGEGYAITNDGTNVYWSNSLGQINSVPIGGGARTLLATSPATEITDAGPAPLDASVDSGGLSTVSNAIYGIAVDGTYVYWTTAGGTLNAVPKAGGATRLLVTEPGAEYYGIAVDAANVYWTDASRTAGRILKTPKPQ